MCGVWLCLSDRWRGGSTLMTDATSGKRDDHQQPGFSPLQTQQVQEKQWFQQGKNPRLQEVKVQQWITAYCRRLGINRLRQEAREASEAGDFDLSIQKLQEVQKRCKIEIDKIDTSNIGKAIRLLRQEKKAKDAGDSERAQQQKQMLDEITSEITDKYDVALQVGGS